MKQPPSRKILFGEKRLKSAFIAWMSTAVFQAKRDYRHALVFVKRRFTICEKSSFLSQDELALPNWFEESPDEEKLRQ
jgi:hypothetical protein